MELGFTNATNLDDFNGWVVGFYGEWSDELAKLPTTLADAQVARWQSKYGRDPMDQQRSWLVNKMRTDIAMKGIKLNAQVTGIIKNLQNMPEKPSRPREREGGWSWSITTGPASKARDHTRADATTAWWGGGCSESLVESRDGQPPPVDPLAA